MRPRRTLGMRLVMYNHEMLYCGWENILELHRAGLSPASLYRCVTKAEEDPGNEAEEDPRE